MILALTFPIKFLSLSLDLFESPLVQSHASSADHDEEGAQEAEEIWVFMLDSDLEKECKDDIVHAHQSAWSKWGQLQSNFD